jgi:hypothetical protein
MFELERCQSAIAGAGQDCECDQGAVSQLNVSGEWHRSEDLGYLLQRRHRLGAARLSDSGIVGWQIEIVGIGIGQL